MERPYVLINVAASVDGKIDTVHRRGAPISGEADRARVDRLRASVDAVMVGGRTLRGEDPRLLVRSAELRAERRARSVPENPAKVGVVSHLAGLKPESRFVTAGPTRVIVFTGRATPGAGADPEGSSGSAPGALESTSGNGNEPLARALRAVGVEVFASATTRVDLRAAMATLVSLGMRRVLVEGGGALNFDLLRLALVDEVQVYLAPLIFGGANAPTLADGDGLSRGNALTLVRTAVEPDPDGGVLLRYKVASS